MGATNVVICSVVDGSSFAFSSDFSLEYTTISAVFSEGVDAGFGAASAGKAFLPGLSWQYAGGLDLAISW